MIAVASVWAANLARALTVLDGVALVVTSTAVVLAHVVNRDHARQLRARVSQSIPGFYVGVPIVHVLSLYVFVLLLSGYSIVELWSRFDHPATWRMPYLLLTFTVGNLAQSALIRTQLRRRAALRELEERDAP